MADNNGLNRYFTWDEDTKRYNGSFLTDKCPENGTEQDITGLRNPTWNGEKWTGESIDDYMANLKEQAGQQPDNNYDKQLQTVATQLLKQNIALSQRVTVLEKGAK